uniref:TOG domain-containing protein n=1 Tax=Heterorhabditis bacteriophora TaxID=37862 RepID=A0A1I7WW02_HETBA
MSGWESLREVDVMSLWPPEQRKNIESTKWQERKESLENLLSLIKKNPKLSSSSMVIYGELMDNLKKIWSVVLDKAKDKKASVRTAVDEALDALSDTFLFYQKLLDFLQGDVDRLCKDLCEHLLKPNPQSKQCICSFLYRLFKRQQTVPLYSIKTIIPILIKLTEDGDQTVRDGACSALGSVKRLLGKSFEAYVQLIGTEKSKLDRIEYYYLLAQREWEEEISSRTVMGGAGDSNSTDANSNGQSDPRTDNVAADYDPWILMEPVDISVKINPKWEEMASFGNIGHPVYYLFRIIFQVNSKKWQERREAVEILITLFESTARVYFTPILAEVIESLIKVLDKDVNINVSSCAAKALARLAIRLRTDFASSVVKVLVICFDKLKERKTLLRNELIELADAAATTLSLTEYADAVVIGMQSKNPQSRAQTAYFIARLFSKHNTSTVPVEGVNHISSGLVKVNKAFKTLKYLLNKYPVKYREFPIFYVNIV